MVLGAPVTDCNSNGVVVAGKQFVAKTIVWAAGVQASPAARWLNAESDRAGRVLTVPGHPAIFVIGDTAAAAIPDGKFVLGIARAARQQDKYTEWLGVAARCGDDPHRAYPVM